MASSKIIWSDKVDAKTGALPRINKVIADDMNEVKTVVNAHADEIDALTLLVGSADSVVFTGKVNEAAGVTKGQVVYISGATGGFPQVSLASNDDYSKSDVLAVAAETKTDGQNVLLVTTGTLENIDTSGFSEGHQLYLGVNGAFVGAHPGGILSVQRIGHVVKVNATTGSIIVEREPLTTANNEDLTLRHTLVNQSAGANASAAYTAINNLNHRASFSMVGAGFTAVAGIAESLVIYNEGYNKTVNAVDGNKGFEWWTDVNDLHNFSATAKMTLSPTGDLTAVSFIGDGSGLTGISASNIGNSDLTQTDLDRYYYLPDLDNASLEVVTTKGTQTFTVSGPGGIKVNNGAGTDVVELGGGSGGAGRIYLQNRNFTIGNNGASQFFIQGLSPYNGKMGLNTGAYLQAPDANRAVELGGHFIKFKDRTLGVEHARFDQNGNFMFNATALVASEKFLVSDDMASKGSDAGSTLGWAHYDVNDILRGGIYNNGDYQFGAFVAPTLAADWQVPTTILFEGLKYEANDLKAVQIIGIVESTVGFTPTAKLIFTLPVGRRPTKKQEYMNCSMGASGLTNGDSVITINTDGTVTLTNVNFLNANQYLRINLTVIL
tara:strand:- start:19924 stop:21744 length:1821 start_codon:yes stop_codon:yes gene_type:complete